MNSNSSRSAGIRWIHWAGVAIQPCPTWHSPWRWLPFPWATALGLTVTRVVPGGWQRWLVHRLCQGGQCASHHQELCSHPWVHCSSVGNESAAASLTSVGVQARLRWVWQSRATALDTMMPRSIILRPPPSLPVLSQAGDGSCSPSPSTGAAPLVLPAASCTHRPACSHPPIPYHPPWAPLALWQRHPAPG